MAILQRAVFVELDYAVLRGMKNYADAASAVLAPHGIQVDPVVFARYFCGKTGAGAVSAVLAKAGVSAEEGPLVTQILEGYKTALAARVPSVKAVCAKFTPALLAKETRIIWVTQLPEADVAAMLGDVVKDGVQVITEPCSHIGCYGWENWRRMCRKLNVHERLSVAVVGSGLSAKGAIAAGLFAAVCMDPLAQNQDCSGVDAMVENFGDSLSKEVMRILWQKA
jgi:hypothetical protein